MPFVAEAPDPTEVLEALDAAPDHAFSAGDYWRKLCPHLRDWGVSRVADITGLDLLGYPVAQACRPAARSNAVTQGKGPDLEAAAVGAVLECLEPAAGESPERLPGARAAPDPALWRDLAPGCDDWPDESTQWVRGWNLASGDEVAVPRDLISTDFAQGAPAEAAAILRHTIGLGAGASLAAAMVHGVLECVENDARLRNPTPRRVASDAAAAQLAELSEKGLRCAFFDMRARVGPAAVMARVMEDPARTPALPLPADGYAARTNAGDAVRAALAEALQTRLAVISGAREDLTQRAYDHGVPQDLLDEEWRRLGSTPLDRLAETDGRVSSPSALAEILEASGVGPIIVAPLHWDPDVPLAITRILAPRLIADPLRLRPEGGA